MSNIKVYLNYFKLRVICELQYRVSALAGMATQIFFVFVFIMVYIAFYDGNASINVPLLPIISFIAGSSVDVTLEQMVTYLWLFQAFFALVIVRQNDNELLDMIRSGNIAYELCKPLNLYCLWFCKILSRKVIGTLLRFWPVMIVAFLLPEPFKLSLPVSFTAFILFIISLILGMIISVIIIFFIHILTFYTLKDKGASSLVIAVSELFAGGYVPIMLMPSGIQIIAYLLPFRYIGDLPFRIYNGTIGIGTSLINMGVQIFWIVILIFISYKLTNRALKRVVVQGG